MRAGAHTRVDLGHQGDDQGAQGVFGQFACRTVAHDTDQRRDRIHQVGDVAGGDGCRLQARDTGRGRFR